MVGFDLLRFAVRAGGHWQASGSYGNLRIPWCGQKSEISGCLPDCVWQWRDAKRLEPLDPEAVDIGPCFRSDL